MAKRYDQLIDIARKYQPRRIVEVGVHRALRAVGMVGAAGAEEYIGYDVFETMDAAFQEDALNGKGMPTEEAARRRLDGYRSKHKGFNYSFIIGDTRDTLHGKSVFADLAFIDGDHRVDAVRGDYEALAESSIVVFDDYYRPDPDGRCPDPSLYGANQVVDALEAAGAKVRILPLGDVCKHGGVSYLAAVYR